MIINRTTIKGRLGHTVVYSIVNFRHDPTDNKFKFDSFDFYTPLGTETNESGCKYFTVTADETEPIVRDSEVDKEFRIIVTTTGNEYHEKLVGDNTDAPSIGLEGDEIASGLIPADPNEDITCVYKEVLNAI